MTKTSVKQVYILDSVKKALDEYLAKNSSVKQLYFISLAITEKIRNDELKQALTKGAIKDEP